MIKEAAEFSNFCQRFKLKMWKAGYKDEKKMDKLAKDIFEYFKIKPNEKNNKKRKIIKTRTRRQMQRYFLPQNEVRVFYLIKSNKA